MCIRGLNASISLAKSRLYQSIGLESFAEDELCEALSEAHSDGCYDCQSGSSMSQLFRGEPSLVSAYKDGFDAAGMNELYGTGTQEEWHALTKEQQDVEWDNFHDLCAQGIADEMYFYDVMMKMHLVGYVGH